MLTRCILFLFLLPMGLMSNPNRQALAKYDAILVYQFGKVASTSLFQLFGDLTPERPLPKEPDHPTRGRCVHTHAGDIIPRYLKKNKILVVNVARNLFTRNLSSFFANIDKPDRVGYIGSKEHILKHVTMEQLKKRFREFNLKHTKKNWYTTFNSLLGIDILSVPFDPAKGYILIQKAGVDVLLLRYEEIGSWPQIFEKALGLKNIEIPRANRARKKWYAHLYEQLKNEYIYSEEEINLFTQVDFMKYLY